MNDHVELASAPESDDGGGGGGGDQAACEAAALEIPGLEGQVFELLQFHVHAGSEHTLNGMQYGAEIHMVHKQRGGGGNRLAVLGVFVTAGGGGSAPSDNNSSSRSNGLFSSILARFDAAADETAAQCGGGNGDTTATAHWWSSSSSSSQQEGDAASSSSSSSNLSDDQQVIDVYGLIPEGSAFYRYDGGLTTPPCTEIVHWSVADKPLAVPVAQFLDLVGLILNYVDSDTCELATIASPLDGTTSRPVQPLNGRTVQRICPVGYVDQEARRFGVVGMAAAVATTAVAVAAAAAALVVLGTSRSYYALCRCCRRHRSSDKDSGLLVRDGNSDFTRSCSNSTIDAAAVAGAGAQDPNATGAAQAGEYRLCITR